MHEEAVSDARAAPAVARAEQAATAVARAEQAATAVARAEQAATAGPSEDVLRTHGLRVTRPRLAVLEVLTGGGHLEVEEIANRVRQRLDSVSTQAVYDVLGALSRAGLARRIEPAGSPARYEARVGDNHHHVVCRGCGVVADVDCATGQAPCLDPSNAHGFEVDEAEVTFWGLCPTCQARRAED